MQIGFVEANGPASDIAMLIETKDTREVLLNLGSNRLCFLMPDISKTPPEINAGSGSRMLQLDAIKMCSQQD